MIFFPVQCCRYGVLYEYSSRGFLKKIILSCLKCVFSPFFVLLAKMHFWWVFQLFCLLMGPPNPRGLHPTSILYVCKVFQHLDMLWMGIWVQPQANIPLEVGILLAKLHFWWAFLLFRLFLGPPITCKLQPTSTSYIYNVFQHPDMLWMSRWGQPQANIPLEAGILLAKMHFGGFSFIVLSVGGPSKPLQTAPHIHIMYTMCFSTLICCGWTCGCTLTLICL